MMCDVLCNAQFYVQCTMDNGHIYMCKAKAAGYFINNVQGHSRNTQVNPGMGLRRTPPPRGTSLLPESGR